MSFEPSGGGAAGVKVLVIDDNPANRKLARYILAAAGYEVLEASEAESGIALARESLPALVLMDIQLPGMDGLAAARILKDEAATCRIPVYAYTTLLPDAAGMQRTRDAGCAGHIMKAAGRAEFLAAVAAALAA